MKIQRKWKFVIIIVVAILLLVAAKSCGSSPQPSSAQTAAKATFAPFTAVGQFFSNLFDFESKKT